MKNKMKKKTAGKDLLQHGQNLERAVWRQRLKKISARLSDASTEVNYNMSAADVIADLEAFANAREKRTRARLRGA